MKNRALWDFKMYYSHTKGNSRGISILLSNKVNFQLSSQIKDKEGQYALVKGHRDHREVTLLNMYKPPGNNKQLIKTFFGLIVTEVSEILI